MPFFDNLKRAVTIAYSSEPANVLTDFMRFFKFSKILFSSEGGFIFEIANSGIADSGAADDDDGDEEGGGDDEKNDADFIDDDSESEEKKKNFS